MARLRYNGLSTTLGASLTSSATAVTFGAALTHSGGTAVPTIGGGDYIPLTILDSTGKASELVYLTAYTSGATSGTITRAQEGTTGVSHASGDKVAHGPTVSDITANRDRKWAPPSGAFSIDEFNDDTLDAAWVRVDGSGAPAGNVAWTEGADVLSMVQSAGDTTAGPCHALLRPLSGGVAVGDAIQAGFVMFTPSASNYPSFGVMLADGTTFGSGNQVVGTISNSTGSVDQNASTWPYSGFNVRAGTISTQTVSFIRGSYIHVRVVCTAANTWRTDISPDGIGWFIGTAIGKTVTPTHAGLFATTYGQSGSTFAASVDYLRRHTGVS